MVESSRRRCLAGLASFGAWLLLPAELRGETEGRPKVVLDRLDFPAELGAKKYRRHLERVLSREVRKVDWGASKDSTIEYRFEVTGLALSTPAPDVLTVTCTAVGRLPSGRSASSRLSFSGAPRERDELVQEVLAIVARGVVARLAELERVRRGKLADRRVRPPTDGD